MSKTNKALQPADLTAMLDDFAASVAHTAKLRERTRILKIVAAHFEDCSKKASCHICSYLEVVALEIMEEPNEQA